MFIVHYTIQQSSFLAPYCLVLQSHSASKHQEVDNISTVNLGPIEELKSYHRCLKNRFLNMQVKESLKGFSVLLFITLAGRADSKQVRNTFILYDFLSSGK